MGLSLGLTLQHVLHLLGRSFAELTQRLKVGHYLHILLSVDCEILLCFSHSFYSSGDAGAAGAEPAALES